MLNSSKDKKDNPIEKNVDYVWKSFKPAKKPVNSLENANHAGDEILRYDAIRKQYHSGNPLPQQPVSVPTDPTQESAEAVVYKL